MAWSNNTAGRSAMERARSNQAHLLRKAVYTSSDWNTFSQSVCTSDYECSNDYLSTDLKGKATLSLDLSNSDANYYPTVRFTFTNIRIMLTLGQEVTMDQFLAMGAAYWNDFAERAAHTKGKRRKLERLM